MLTLTFLGVGAAFAKRNFHSNALIESWARSPSEQAEPDDTLLLDFGALGPSAIHLIKDKPGFEYLKRGAIVDYNKIRRIFVTHQHADHIGGLEELAFMNVFVLADPATGKTFKPQIISSMNILVNLWDTSLKGGMSPMPGRYALLQDYFFILALRSSANGYEPFHMSKRYQFDIFPTDHIRIERKYDWPSYGITITDTQTGASIFFSGDTRFDFEAYKERMSKAKLVFHDTQLYDDPNAVHALLSELRTMPPEIKRKTILYHYGDDFDDPKYAMIPDEFIGLAKPHHRYVLFE